MNEVNWEHSDPNEVNWEHSDPNEVNWEHSDPNEVNWEHSDLGERSVQRANKKLNLNRESNYSNNSYISNKVL